MAYSFRRDNEGEDAYTGMYLAPDGRWRSAGTYPSKRAAQRAAHREEQSVEEGRWRDRALGATTFATYVEATWFPSKHLELSTRQSHRSYLDHHFLPYFGCCHTMLHSIFVRAVRDQLIVANPRAHTQVLVVKVVVEVRTSPCSR